MTTVSNQIRDAIVDRLRVVGDGWKSIRKVPGPTIQIGDTPVLGVYVIRENFQPDGDANVGPPRYIADAVISVMVLDQASKPSVVEGSVDDLVATILDTLLCDPTFVSLKDTNGDYLIEEISSIAKSYQFPQQGDAYYVEARLQFTIRYRVQFPPNTPTDLDTIAIEPSPQPLGATSIMDINLQ